MFSLIKTTVKAIFFSGENRFPKNSGGALNIDQVLKDMASCSPTLPNNPETRGLVLQEARNSLNEVKALTEYQDEKASRLLTAVAFLMAAAVGIFVKFIDIFPFAKYSFSASFGEFLVVAAYAVFWVYGVLTMWGTFLIFVGTQSRFLWGQGGFNAERDSVRSRLFFRSIVETRPDTWAKSFLCTTASASSEAGLDVLNEYYRNYVSETYLVAAKVAEKLLYLEPAQIILRSSMLVLMAWGLLFGAAMEFSEPRGKDFEVVSHPARAQSLLPNPTGASSNGAEAGALKKDEISTDTPIRIEINNHNDATSSYPVPVTGRIKKANENGKECSCADRCGQHVVGHQCSISGGAK